MIMRPPRQTVPSCWQKIRRVWGFGHAAGINPALPANQPDDADACRDRRETGDSQHILGRCMNLGGQPLRQVREAAIDQALDDEDEAYGG